MPVERLSYSSINLFQQCPRAWEYRYIKKPDTLTSCALPFGSAFHDAIETYLGAKTEEPDNVKPPAELWSHCWQEQIERNGVDRIDWDKPQEYYTQLGQKMLSAPDVVKTIDSIDILVENDIPAVEKRVTFNVPGVPVEILGFIDGIETDGIPFDLKTASRAWTKDKAHKELQVNFYLLALNQNGYIVPDWKFRYYVFTKSTKSPKAQMLETTRTVGELMWTMELIREVWEAIQSGVFPRNPTGWKCNPKYCEFSHLCKPHG